MNAKLKDLFKVFLFTAALLQISAFHPFYLSVTEIKYNSEDRKLEAAVKIFANDLEEALVKTSGKKVDLLNPDKNEENKILLMPYLASRLVFESDGKFVNTRLLGYEREEEAIWIYIDADLPQVPKQFRVINRILCESIPAQSNIVHLDLGNGRKSVKMDCGMTEYDFDLRNN